MAVILNGYEYSVSHLDVDGSSIDVEVTEEEEFEAAKQLEEFMSCIEEHSDEEIEKWKKIRSTEGLTDRVCRKLYDLFYDLCYWGDKTEEWLMREFRLSEKDLGILKKVLN